MHALVWGADNHSAEGGGGITQAAVYRFTHATVWLGVRGHVAPATSIRNLFGLLFGCQIE